MGVLTRGFPRNSIPGHREGETGPPGAACAGNGETSERGDSVFKRRCRLVQGLERLLSEQGNNILPV